MENTYDLSELIKNLGFRQLGIMVKVGNHKNSNYSRTGTVVYYDENDDGALKFLHSGNDVIVCKSLDDSDGDRWIIVDR